MLLRQIQRGGFGRPRMQVPASLGTRHQVAPLQLREFGDPDAGHIKKTGQQPVAAGRRLIDQFCRLAFLEDALGQPIGIRPNESRDLMARLVHGLTEPIHLAAVGAPGTHADLGPEPEFDESGIIRPRGGIPEPARKYAPVRLFRS